MAESTKKALLIDVIGEDAVVEGIEFDFEAGTFKNVFGGNTITITNADRIAAKSQKFANCAVVHCTDEDINAKSDENALAAVLVATGDALPHIYGKAIVVKQIAGSTSGFELFTDDELTELIDLCDAIVQEYVASQE